MNGGLIMLAEVKRCIESNDIKGLHYIFVDSLDVDPTFEKYNGDYEYCKGINGFLEPHVDITPFLSSERWNEKYWVQIKMDLMKNFSEKRFSHMRDVAKVIYSEKIKRLDEERKKIEEKHRALELEKQEIERNQKEQMARIEAARQNNNVSANKSPVVNSQILDVEKAEKERIEEKRRALELEKQEIERNQKEQMARIEAARQNNKESKNNKSYVQTPKKATGAVVVPIVIIALIVVIVLILIIGL